MDTLQDQKEFSHEERLISKENKNSLWRTAKKRAFFKQFAIIYIAVSIVLVMLWYVTSGIHTYFWPKWLMLVWGVGVVIQYIGAYHGGKLISAEREYEKLKRQIN